MTRTSSNNGIIVHDWTFRDNEGVAISVVATLERATNKVFASAVGPGRAGVVQGIMVRERYRRPGGTWHVDATRYMVSTSDGVELDWERTAKDAVIRAGNLAIERALDAYRGKAPRHAF